MPEDDFQVDRPLAPGHLHVGVMSVRRYLIRQGVDADRLDAKGYGPDRPRVPNARTKEELAKNRRVELRIPESARPTDDSPTTPATEKR